MKHTVTEIKISNGKFVFSYHTISFRTIKELEKKFVELAGKLGYETSVPVYEQNYRPSPSNPLGYYFNTPDWESGSIVCKEEK